MRVNLIPMAGAGKRFSDEGYTLPKPLIDVNGKPMIIEACQSLPQADLWIFVIREEHQSQFPLKETLLKEFPNSKFISIDYLTEGQATTASLAKDLIPENSELFIGPCDNGMTWNELEWKKIMNDAQVDACIWTFRNNATVKRNPKMYGWVKTEGNNAISVSCKIPISDNPVQDHAIVGSFYFKKAKDFFNAYEVMFSKNRRINNEFYIDELMNELIEKKQKVKVFEIDHYLCYGTPNDLKTYEYWKHFFQIAY